MEKIDKGLLYFSCRISTRIKGIAAYVYIISNDKLYNVGENQGEIKDTVNEVYFTDSYLNDNYLIDENLSDKYNSLEDFAQSFVNRLVEEELVPRTRSGSNNKELITITIFNNQKKVFESSYTV